MSLVQVIERVRGEVAILSSLQHANIVSFYGFEERGHELRIYMELVPSSLHKARYLGKSPTRGLSFFTLFYLSPLHFFGFDLIPSCSDYLCATVGPLAAIVRRGLPHRARRGPRSALPAHPAPSHNPPRRQGPCQFGRFLYLEHFNIFSFNFNHFFLSLHAMSKTDDRNKILWNSSITIDLFSLSLSSRVCALQASTQLTVLQSKNVLIDWPDGRDIASVKLCDFGVSREVAEGDLHAETRIGTVRFMAPEVIEGSYDKQVPDPLITRYGQTYPIRER